MGESRWLPGPEAGTDPTGAQGCEEHEQGEEGDAVAGRREESDYREAVHADEGGEEDELLPTPGQQQAEQCQRCDDPEGESQPPLPQGRRQNRRVVAPEVYVLISTNLVSVPEEEELPG